MNSKSSVWLGKNKKAAVVLEVAERVGIAAQENDSGFGGERAQIIERHCVRDAWQLAVELDHGMLAAVGEAR